MAEAPSKRQRENEAVGTAETDETKRHKSYNDILSFLESEEDEPTQDLSSLITTLQQEISPESAPSESSPITENDQNGPAGSHTPGVYSFSSYSSSSKDEEEDDKEKVIRHLLEASDDELGIPNIDVGSSTTTSTVSSSIDDYGEVGFNGGDISKNINIDFVVCDGLWELEDEAANYYTLLQSELFL